MSAKKKCENLKSVICMDPLTEEDKKQAKEVGVELYAINEVMKMGSEKPQNSPQISPDDIYTIMYTSGTTGNPKVNYRFNFIFAYLSFSFFHRVLF